MHPLSTQDLKVIFIIEHLGIILGRYKYYILSIGYVGRNMNHVKCFPVSRNFYYAASKSFVTIIIIVQTIENRQIFMSTQQNTHIKIN